jgi:hypothetical protein
MLFRHLGVTLGNDVAPRPIAAEKPEGIAAASVSPFPLRTTATTVLLLTGRSMWLSQREAFLTLVQR